jgi:hypothetical protein
MNYSDYSLTTNKNILDLEQTSIFQQNINELNPSNSIKIYRGNNRNNFRDWFNNHEVELISEKIFLVGEKGRNFLQQRKNDSKNLIQIEFNDNKSKVFKKIFSILNHIMNCPNFNLEFATNNSDFYNYFKKQENLNDFLSICESANQEAKTMIIDHYLTFVHQHGENPYYLLSSYLSFSRNYSKANEFAGSREEKIILHGWLPIHRNTHKYCLTFDYLNDVKDYLKMLGFPVYFDTYYPDEKELTLKGGLLPHFIIGFEYWESTNPKSFEVNPLLLSNYNLKNWIKNGLPIDQSGFWNTLKKTHYKRGYVVDYSGNYYNAN